nr:PREDICTED: uncharacterized protein LOC109041690 [Bemisia tabaci]
MTAVRSDYFVDKTKLIKVLFERRNDEHVVFHGPKRFGKTVNMDMIRTFIEIETDENGYIADRLKLTKRNVFEKLAIGNDKKVFQEYFAAFPVIKFSFNIAPRSYDHFIRRFAHMISTEYRRQKRNHFFHGYGVDNPKSAYANNTQLARLFEKYAMDPDQVPESELLNAGNALANLLYDIFNRPAILLIDEYDVPIRLALLNPNVEDDDASKIIDFLAEFLKSLVKSGHKLVERSLLTGITRVGSTYTHEINNLNFYRIFDDPHIAPYYGFTREEVIHLTKKFSVEDKIDLMTDYYDGFKIDKDSSMFCMQSVLKFLASGKLCSYWNPFDHYFDSFFEFEQMGSYFDENIDKEISCVMKEKIEKDDLLTLKKYIKRDNFTEYRSPTFYLILQILVDEGAFTIVRRVGQERTFIKITNIEIKQQLIRKMYTTKFYLKKFNTPEDLLQKYIISAASLKNDNSSFIQFKKSINALLNLMKPSKEIGMQEVLCQALRTESKKSPLSEIVYVDSGVRVKNVTRKQSKSENHDSSKTTTSILDCLYVLDYGSEETGIILELKYKQESSRLALTQILDRQYYKTFDQDLKRRNVFNIKTEVFIGIHYDPTANKTSLSYLWNDRDLKKAQHV